MIKRDEIEDSNSCFNKAHNEERLFVLLARDPAAPVAIRAWGAERIRLGKNSPGDEHLREALECAALMDLERSEIEAARRQESIRWDAAAEIKISRFASTRDMLPHAQTVSWLDFVAIFMKPRRASCTRGNCARVNCFHNQGPCWSPATYMGDQRRRDNVEAISLLVFDINGASEDCLNATRKCLEGYRYLIHATHSDLPGSRVVRIVVALSRPVKRDEWPRFWRTSVSKFTVTDVWIYPVVDLACDDLCRIYYLPSRPSDADYFVDTRDGAPLDVNTILLESSEIEAACRQESIRGAEGGGAP